MEANNSGLISKLRARVCESSLMRIRVQPARVRSSAATSVMRKIAAPFRSSLDEEDFNKCTWCGLTRHTRSTKQSGRLRNRRVCDRVGADETSDSNCLYCVINSRWVAPRGADGSLTVTRSLHFTSARSPLRSNRRLRQSVETSEKSLKQHLSQC